MKQNARAIVIPSQPPIEQGLLELVSIIYRPKIYRAHFDVDSFSLFLKWSSIDQCIAVILLFPADYIRGCIRTQL